MLAITHVLQKTQINRLGTVHDGDLRGLRNNGTHLLCVPSHETKYKLMILNADFMPPRPQRA